MPKPGFVGDSVWDKASADVRARVSLSFSLTRNLLLLLEILLAPGASSSWAQERGQNLGQCLPSSLSRGLHRSNPPKPELAYPQIQSLQVSPKSPFIFLALAHFSFVCVFMFLCAATDFALNILQ
ncbi:hypothetical protein KQX54_004491 [Cotesia glomerata]|uniref:Uncharacterized protein n=1 Tax=Cotesia glomerata TaxID=32391 RepID=A0AAV7IJB1_COTGL|nr:hypothetical protein KQX54_004491 [Cotesia glomerata]